MNDYRSSHKEAFRVEHLRFAGRGHLITAPVGLDGHRLHALVKIDAEICVIGKAHRKVCAYLREAYPEPHISPPFRISFAVVDMWLDATA